MATPKRRAKKKTAAKKSKVVEALRVARSEDWSGEWLALLAVYGGPRKFAETLGITYQTIWRYRDASSIPESKKLLIAMLAAHKGLKSPV